jgi:L-ribulokinase
MLGAVAAGADAGGHASIGEAAVAMAPAAADTYTPQPEAVRVYGELHVLYRELYELFGRQSRLMHRLRALR